MYKSILEYDNTNMLEYVVILICGCSFVKQIS